MTMQAVAMNSGELSALRNASLERFQGQIPPAKVPLLYRIGLFFVAVAMVLLPLIYIGLIGLAGYAVYRDHIGLPVKKENLRDLDDLLERQDREETELEALGRYFQNQINPMRPLAVAAHAQAPAGDPGQALGLLKAARERMVAAVPAFATANKVYRKAKGERRRQELVSGLTPLEDAARERLALGLHLLHLPGLDDKLPEAPALRAEAARLLPLLNQLHEMGPALQGLNDEWAALGEMAGQIEQRRSDEAFVRSLLARINKVGAAWRAAVQAIPSVPYPFEHANGQVPLRKFLVTGSAIRDDLGQTAEAAQELLSKSVGLYIRVLGRLALAAEKAETAAGLEPLPDPPKSKDDEDD